MVEPARGGGKNRPENWRCPTVVRADLRRGVVFSFPTVWARRTFQFNFQMGRTKAYLWNVRQERERARGDRQDARDPSFLRLR